MKHKSKEVKDGFKWIKCDCPCHRNKMFKHVIACCVNGYKQVPDYFPEKKDATNFHIKENLSQIKNENVFNAERYYEKQK